MSSGSGRGGVEGGSRPTRSRPDDGDRGREPPAARIEHRDARRLDFVGDAMVDMVLTDPPYFDNIAYSGLSDFYRPWAQQFGLAAPDGPGADGLRDDLAARGRDDESADIYRDGLGACFREVARVLKPRGRLVFTFQHRTAPARGAPAWALASAGLRPVRLVPLLGDGRAGPHAHEGSSTWDAVFVRAGAGRRRGGRR
jgi:hypothetical protein